LVANEAQGQQLAGLAQELLAGQGLVELVTFDNQGVQVESA
jgi:hypothetical protein